MQVPAPVVALHSCGAAHNPPQLMLPPHPSLAVPQLLVPHACAFVFGVHVHNPLVHVSGLVQVFWFTHCKQPFTDWQTCGVLPVHCFAPDVQVGVQVAMQVPLLHTWFVPQAFWFTQVVQSSMSWQTCGMPALLHCFASFVHWFVHVMHALLFCVVVLVTLPDWQW